MIKNKERLLKAEVSAQFFAAVLKQANKKGLLSNEHFTVDGTLIEAWASIKSFRPKDGPPQGPVSQSFSNDTMTSLPFTLIPDYCCQS